MVGGQSHGIGYSAAVERRQEVTQLSVELGQL